MVSRVNIINSWISAFNVNCSYNIYIVIVYNVVLLMHSIAEMSEIRKVSENNVRAVEPARGRC